MRIMAMAQLSSKRGMNAERRAADFLVTQGLRILCTNYRARRGEIDVVALVKREDLWDNYYKKWKH